MWCVYTVEHYLVFKNEIKNSQVSDRSSEIIQTRKRNTAGTQLYVNICCYVFDNQATNYISTPAKYKVREW